MQNFVVRKVMISKYMDDLGQRENLYHSKCLTKDDIFSIDHK